MSRPTADPAAIPTGFVLRWIGGLFLAPPDAPALAAYRGRDGQALLDRLAETPALAPPVAELKALSAVGGDLDEAAGRLAAAHAAAFLIGGRRGAPPYASVWLSERGLIYQAPARAMTRLLAATELSLPDDLPEPPDHIGIQLNLLAELDARHQAGEATPLAPADFIRDHLLTWLPGFSAACARLRDPMLYPALSASLMPYLSDHQ